MWGTHCDEPSLDFVGHGFVSLGWSRMPDVRTLGPDRETLKTVLAAAYPRAKPGAIPVWAGQFLRFGFEMEPGDLVVYPEKATRTVAIGEVAGDYEWHEGVVHPHRRAVRWLEVDVPRHAFSRGALHEIGSSLTLFRVRRNGDEFRRLVHRQLSTAANMLGANRDRRKE